MRPTILLLLTATALLACGTSSSGRVSETVDESLVALFPSEGRRWLYEAENEVIIALDRRDAARAFAAERKAELERGRAAQDKAAERGRGEPVAAARVKFFELREEEAELLEDAAVLGIECARANLELTKARLAVRFDLPVDDAGFVHRYEEQYASCAGEQASTRERAEKIAREAVKARENWRKQRTEFARKTGDYDHGLWID